MNGHPDQRPPEALSLGPSVTSGFPAPDDAADPEDAAVTGEAAGARDDGPPEVARLRAAVSALDDLDEVPVAEHVPRYDALHGELSEALASIDEV